MNEPLPQFSTQEESMMLFEQSNHVSVGLVKDFIPSRGIVLLSPSKLAKLKEENIQIWVERRFGLHASYTDLDYADAGADILDNAFSVIQSANIIVKLDPLTLGEAHFLKPKQVVVSSLDTINPSPEYFSILKEKQITAFALDAIEDMDENGMLNDIFYREETPADITSSLGNFILPIIASLVFSNNIRATIQTNPTLFQSLYCYDGEIAKKEIAEKLSLPWRDFLSLYWNLN